MNNLFEIMPNEELDNIDGGLVGGIIVGGLNGAALGLASAVVGAFVCDDWTYEDSMNMLKSYTVAGIALGTALPL